MRRLPYGPSRGVARKFQDQIGIDAGHLAGVPARRMREAVWAEPCGNHERLPRAFRPPHSFRPAQIAHQLPPLPPGESPEVRAPDPLGVKSAVRLDPPAQKRTSPRAQPIPARHRPQDAKHLFGIRRRVVAAARPDRGSRRLGRDLDRAERAVHGGILR